LFDVVIATTTKDFGRHSFIEWHLKENFHKETTSVPYQTDLRMMFRTRQRSGSLFIAQNQQKWQHIILEVLTKCHLSFLCRSSLHGILLGVVMQSVLTVLFVCL